MWVNKQLLVMGSRLEASMEYFDPFMIVDRQDARQTAWGAAPDCPLFFSIPKKLTSLLPLRRSHT